MTVAGRSGSRRSEHERTAIAVSAVAALVIHAAAGTAASATGLFAGWGGIGAAAAKQASDQPETPLDPSCDGDAVLATAARALTCVSPFVDSRRHCADELAARLESDRLRCHVDELAPVAFTLDRIDVRRLRQLDPEPLLEQLEAERLQPQPPQPEPPQVAMAEPPKPQPPQPPPPQAKPRNQQVIETAKPESEQEPEHARFISDHNTRVAKETVARGSNREEIVAKSKPAELAIKENPREPSIAEPPKPDRPGQHPDAPRAPGALSMRSLGAPKPDTVSQPPVERGDKRGSPAPIADGMTARRGDGRIAITERRPSELPQGEGGAGGGAVPVPNLRASQEVLERAVGGGSVDHLEGIAEGDETALNSKQWVYASFFNRMKRRVHQNWDPVSVWRRHDPTGSVYGTKSRITRLRITLGPSGEVKRVIVISSSDVDVLDDEAVRAFKAAQPFPNPPAGLLNEQGVVTFDFGFHLEINNGKSQWKIFRAM